MLFIIVVIFSIIVVEYFMVRSVLTVVHIHLQLKCVERSLRCR